MKKFRLFSQIFFLLLFFYFFINTLINNTAANSEFELKEGVVYIFASDPLLAVTAFFATGTLKWIFIISAFFVVMTLIFGRVFCGFVCPMGTILHFFSFIAKKITSFNIRTPEYDKKIFIKYYILFAILFLSLFEINVSGYLDPLALLFKILNIFILPILEVIYNFNNLPYTLQDILFYNVLGRETMYYEGVWVFGAIFTLLILLNFVKSRFWCRYICPLGAFYGVMAKYSFFKIKTTTKCTNCSLCDDSCLAGANPSSENFKSSECMLLFDCLNSCKNEAVLYTKEVKPSNLDFDRRKVIKSLGLSTAALAILAVSKKNPAKNEYLIRPPGALQEDEFLKTCIRCGACMKVCPENFLAPSIVEGGILDLFSPIGKPDFGYCLYNCNLCGKACPTGAIKKLSVSEKQKFVIGTAFIDKDRCLPYAYKINCAVCEEHCPTTKKAIHFDIEDSFDKNGEKIKLKKPVIDPESCIGCGICQFKCPVTDKPAIYITSIKNGGILTNYIY